MAPRNEDAATQAKALKPPSRDWVVEDILKEFKVFRSFAKMFSHNGHTYQYTVLISRMPLS